MEFAVTVFPISLETFGPSLHLPSLFVVPIVFWDSLSSVIGHGGESCHGHNYFKGAEGWW